MSISQDSTATIVCREVFDETSPPTNEEILDYAKRLGIDPETEPHLLDVAREGLIAPLPAGWKPCRVESPRSNHPMYYYFDETTGETSWEHPLDSVYKRLVQEARGNKLHSSFEDDSKTSAKEIESHEEVTLPKEPIPSTSFSGQTKIPKKLPPIKKSNNESFGVRKKDTSGDRQQTKKSNETVKFDNPNYSSLMTDRTSRDYTNLRFQDPNFYTSPKLLESPKKEPDLQEVLKRSESLSPRYEKDWEQLSGKFNSEENIIDIDKLSGSALAKLESNCNTMNTEKQQQSSQQKELTLSGGGSIYLKSNRSKDNTPSQDGGKLEDFQTLATSEETCSTTGDKLKSILRDKIIEEDDKPNDEERKSVRFVECQDDIRFTYSGSEDEYESDSDNKMGSTTFISDQRTTSTHTFRRQVSHQYDLHTLGDSIENYSNNMGKDYSKKKFDHTENVDNFLKTSKKVGKRFVVENVSENEHINQMGMGNYNESEDEYYSNKFENIKNIDIFSMNESDLSADRSSDSKLSLEQLRRSKEQMLENMKKFDQQRVVDKQREKDQMLHLMKLRHDIEAAKLERFNDNFENVKINLNREHEEKIRLLKKEFDEKLKYFRQELEENLNKEKMILEQNIKERLDSLKREMADREEMEIHKLITEMDDTRADNLKQVKNELEVCYDKERQDILSNLKIELDQRKKELLELRNNEMQKLEKEYEKDLNDEKQAKICEYEIMKEHKEKIEILKKDLEKELEVLTEQLKLKQKENIAKITEDHEKNLAKILQDFRIDENLTRKVYKQRLEEIRAELSKDLENETRKQNEQAVRQETIDFEKMRCEKRLLEDKYNTLKEKYLKLKKEVRLIVERRNKRKEGNTTASETEKSTSVRTRTESDQKSSPKKTRSNSITNSKSQEYSTENEIGIKDAESRKSASEFQIAGVSIGTKTTTKFESDDTTTASETQPNLLKKKKLFTRKTSSAVKLNNNNNNIGNPVENIRKQLEKLEDIGDLLPTNETAYTVRYPFQDESPANVSSELDFFRHRIHVERDSVRRAREALRLQKSAFQGRQRAWKQRSSRATFEQLVKEERELSDMEVTLHRTRSLLGEKVIHLRHLEQSLERVANAKKSEGETGVTKNEEMTLSDVSSASSGFSSTDLGTDTCIDKPDHYQESTEIIASLENLNSEIREIWDVLNKRQDNNMPPPPALMYPELNWLPCQPFTTQPSAMPTFGTPNIQSNILSQLTAAHSPATTTQNIISQYGPNSGFTTSVGTVDRTASNIMERTRNLRDWLRQARIENSDLISPGQATL